MTEEEAKEISLEVWRYLAEHPEIKYKRNLPKELVDKIEEFSCWCPLCELFCAYDYCPGCPLDDANCKNDNSLFDLWEHSPYGEEGRAQRAKAAAEIARKIKAWEPE